MPEKTRAELLAQAHKLLTRAMLPTSKDDHEALAAYQKYRTLVARHGFGLEELKPPSGASAAWTVEDFLRAADRGKEVIAATRAVLADPEVQKTVGAARDLAAGVVSFFKRRTG